MKSWKVAVVAFGLFIFGNGCYFTSRQPITEHPVPGCDPTLLGIWKIVPQDNENRREDQYILFTEETDGHLIVVLMENQYRFSELYRGFISEIKGVHYLNVKTIRSEGGLFAKKIDENYTLVQYEIVDRQTLHIRMLEEDPIRQAIKDKAIDGTISKNRYTDDILLTATSAQLTDFFGKQEMSGWLEPKPFVTAQRIGQLPKYVEEEKP